MASETTTSNATEFVLSEFIEPMVYEAAYGGNRIGRFVREVDISGLSTNSAELPKYPLLSASDLTESVDMANSAFNPTSVSVTADEAGLMIELTDMLVNSDIHGGIESYARQLGLAVGDKIDADLAAEFADFTGSVGATTVDLSETNWLDGIAALEIGNAVGPFVAILHPQQLRDLRVDIATSAGAVWGASAGPRALTAGMESKDGLAEFYGVLAVKSTNCTTANAGADRLGAMLPSKENAGIVLVTKRDMYIETDRDASKRSTEVVCVAVYGDECANVAANGGIKIISDA
jgi:hypothetical protein